MQIMTYGNVNFECVCKIHGNVHPSRFTLYFAHKRLVANLMNGVQVVVVNTLLPLSFIAAPSFDFSIYVALETSLDVKYLKRVLSNLNINCLMALWRQNIVKGLLCYIQTFTYKR